MEVGFRQSVCLVPLGNRTVTESKKIKGIKKIKKITF